MSYEVEMPESTDAGGGNFATEEGWFHFACTEMDEQPTNKAGTQMLEGFRASAEILNGEVAGQEGKSLDFMFFNPKLTDKNNGEMAKKKQARFLLATGILDSSAAKPGEKVTVDLQQAVGRQFVAKVVHDSREDGKKFLQLNFADIYHVDDPAVAKVPKSQNALKLLPPTLRRKPESFAKPGTSHGTASGNGSAKKESPARETAPASNVDPSDL